MGEATDRRRVKILAAALGVLRERGGEGLTTGAVAAAAGCSKATIYGIFSSRQNLLAALAGDHAEAVAALLRRGMAGGDSPTGTLMRIGALLLDAATGAAAIAILRASAGDGRLGGVLLESRRTRIAPLLEVPIRALVAQGRLDDLPPGELAGAFESFLLGDRPVRLLLGDETARPRPGQFAPLARDAAERFMFAFAPKASRATG